MNKKKGKKETIDQIYILVQANVLLYVERVVVLK